MHSAGTYIFKQSLGAEARDTPADGAETTKACDDVWNKRVGSLLLCDSSSYANEIQIWSCEVY